MKRIRIYAMTLLLTIVAAVAQAQQQQPTTLPGSTGLSCGENDGVYGVRNIWGSMFDSNVPNAIGWQDWGGCTIGSDININGATIKTITFVDGYSGSGWVGYVLSNDPANVTVDLSAATEMNVWVWSNNDTEIGLEFQSATNQDANNHKYKSSRTLPVTGGKWNLISVPLIEMEEKGGTGSSLVDIKNFSIVQNFSEQTEHTIYVSDIFFTEYRDFVNGQHYRLWDIDNTWEPMRDFFSPNVDGTYTFNAITGKYRLTKVDAKKFVRVDPLRSDGSTTATYNTSDGSGAIWMRGGIRFDIPQFTSSTENWTPAKNFAMAQVAAGAYQSTMTIGKELGAENDGSTFKMFDQSGLEWGEELSPNASDNARKVSMSNYLFEFNGNGDVIHKNARRLHEGDEWQFEAHVKSPASDGLTLTANRVWLNTADLQPAPTPVATRDQRVLPVFTDAISGSIGLKKSKYSDVITWGPNAAEEYVNGDAATHTDMTPRTYTDDQSNQFIALEFKVETSVNRGWVNLHFDTPQDLTGYETLHMDVKDLDGLNTEMYIWPRKTDDTPSLPSAKTKSALRFNLMDGTDANGWKSIDIPLSAIIGLDGITDLTNIDHIGIQGPNTDAKGAIAIDNVYFTKDVSFTTYDNDGRGIDWNTSTGTTCYVDKIVWVKRGTQNIDETYNDNWAKIHDGDIYTYFQLNRDDTDGDNEHSQILVELKDNIRVSDVEVIWANGYAKTYNVYAFESWPVMDGEIPASALTPDNLLYSVSNLQMDHEPYFVTKSELQKNVEHNSRYLLLDLIERGNGDTFGYYIDEVHAGAYDEEYNTPHHLNIPDYVIKTEIDKTLEVTVRNKRNAILSDYTSSILAETVKTSWESPLLKKRGNQETVVYGTAPGTHEVTVTGTVNGVTGLVPGTSTVKVYKNWKPENDTWKSLVQPIYDKYKTDIEANPLTNTHIWASYSETWGTPARTYYPWKAADGIEASNDHSRWSSAYADYNQHDAIQGQQYWVIDLDDTYELTDIEVVWERAIASEYSVFGFTSLDGVTLAQEYDDFLSAQSAHLIYTTVLPEVLEFPYHDQHTGNSTTAPIIENNRAKFLVIKPKAPLTTHTFVGHNYSIWEVYAWGADVTVTDNVTELKTPNLSVKVGHEGVVDVTAYGGYDDDTQEYQYQESEWFPVEFSVPASSNYYIKHISNIDPSTGKTVDQYFLFKKVEGQAAEQYNTADALAYIVDNDNGTYGVKVMPGIAGLGQTEGDYDDDNDTTDTKSITINMESTNTNPNTQDPTIKGQFELVIYKEPMALLTGKSTDQRQVYDDGYYSESELKNNITAETVTIDLRNVDFSYDNAGTTLSSTEIPAPHTVSKVEGGSKVQLNPNTIYYTDETVGTISGGNLAFRQGEVWRVPVLRIFDGWDWSPITNEGGMIANKATFYTSIPAKHYSFFAMPFVPNPSTVLDKGVKVYKPSAFRPERNAVKLDELTSDDFSSGFEGKPYVLYTENTNLYQPNGYKVAFTSNGEVSVPYDPREWNNNGATIIPSYVKLNMQEIANGDAANDYYMYSIMNDQFLTVGTDDLAEDGWNGASGSATELRPFYAYMKVPSTQSSGAPAMTFTLVDEDEVTGIDNATAETDENVEVYDVQGRYVGNCVRTHLTPGIYIVKKADGSTRKVYIRK